MSPTRPPLTVQQGNLRRQDDGTLIVSCPDADCPWSEPLATELAAWDKGAVLDEAERKLRAHLEALHPEPAEPALTATELEALDLSGKLADLISQCVAAGPTAAQDTAELHHHLHAIQRYIGSQAAARAYPERFRLLGEVGTWNERAKPAEPPANPFEGDREQAEAMGLCRECGEGRYGHTYTVLCWWMRRWQQKDATW